jgi:AbiV family abortive infection protein
MELGSVVTKRDVIALSKEALSKANEHLIAAETIAGLGYYSMAFSHVVLGLEEWLKRVVIEAHYLGIIQVENKKSADIFTISEKNLFSHKAKQLGAVFLLAFLIPIRGRMELIMRAKEAGKEVSHDLLAERFRRDLGTVGELVTIWDKLEGMKQAGLYSGRKDKGGASISSASASEFEKYSKLLEEQLEIENFYDKHQFSKDEIEKIRTWTEALKKDFLEEFTKKG